MNPYKFWKKQLNCFIARSLLILYIYSIQFNHPVKMKKPLILFLVASSLVIAGCGNGKLPAPKEFDTVLVSDTIQYHPVRINKYDGSILPWYSSDAGAFIRHNINAGLEFLEEYGDGFKRIKILYESPGMENL